MDSRLHLNSEDLSEHGDDDSVHGVDHVDTAAPGETSRAEREQKI